MIAAIVQGGSTPGLLNYLVGPGRANEHSSPHLVAGSQIIMDRFQEWDSLTPAQGYEIAKYVDQYMSELGIKPTGSARQYNHATGKVERVSATPNHVWHCSLSLSPEEGPLSQETWRKIAEDFMSEMGFTGSDGKAACRWVAVHHGSAKNGGDHIHIAANIVREDGTKWSNWQDQRRAQRTVNMIEHRYGLRVVEAREHARGARADSAADLRATQDRHLKALKDLVGEETRTQVATDRARLEVRVRAAAVGARSEADFVALLRDYGVRVRPRFEQGRTDVISGYSVALANHDPNARTQWYGGGRLARDLALPRLRMRWPDTPQGAQRAAVAWRQVWKGERVTGYDSKRATSPRPSRKHTQSRNDWRVNAALVRAWHERVSTINPHDSVALADATRDVSGLLAAAGLGSDNAAARHALMRASRGLGRHAQTHTRPSFRAPASHAASSAIRALTKARTSNELAVALLVAEIVELARSLSDLYAQAEQTDTALAILRDTQQAWQMLHSPTPQLAYSQTALREAASVNLPPAYTPGTGTPTTPNAERVATRELARAADTSRTLTFNTPQQIETTQQAVAASVLADVLDEHPTIAAVTVTRSITVSSSSVELRAIDADGQAVTAASQQLTETMSRATAPALFADRLAGRTYSREDFLEQINRPLIVAATSSAHEVLTDERADRIRAMQQAAMPASMSAAQQPPVHDGDASTPAHEVSVVAVATDKDNPWLTINQPATNASPQASANASTQAGEQEAGHEGEVPSQKPTVAEEQLARARSMFEAALPASGITTKPARPSSDEPPKHPPSRTETQQQRPAL